MSDFMNAVPTAKGLALLAKAQAGEAQLEFTRIAVGDGTYTEKEKEPSELYGMTDLKSPKQSYTVAKKEKENDRTVKLTFIISNWDFEGDPLFDEGFAINEMGLYCKEKGGDDSTEVLYSVAVVSGNGDPFPAYTGINPTEIEQVWYATVDRASNVSITIDPNRIIVDDALDKTSKNPVENRAIATELEDLKNLLKSIIQTGKITAPAVTKSGMRLVTKSGNKLVFNKKIGG